MSARRLCTAVILVLGIVLPGPAAGAPVRTTHKWHVSVTGPAQFDLTFAELRFHGTGASSSLGLSLTGAPGLYFVAGAVVRHPRSGGPRILVVVVNERPRGSLAPDRATIGLGVTGASGLGAPMVRQLANPFPRPVGGTSSRRVCGLGPNHAAGDLRSLLSAGRALPGFSTTVAVAQAYDVACGLSFDATFEQAVTGCGTSLVAGCCPPNAMCVAPAAPPPPVPTPTPNPPGIPTPIPSPPACPCPAPPPCAVGYACPLAMTRDFMRVIACPLGASPNIAC